MEKVIALYIGAPCGPGAPCPAPLELQKEALEQWCRKEGDPEHVFYREDTRSEKNLFRIVLKCLMADIRAGKVSRVVVVSFSCLGKSMTELLSALEEIRRSGAAVLSIQEEIEVSASAEQVPFKLVPILARLERAFIAARVRAGLAGARSRGKKLGRGKTRPSKLIRALLKANMSCREIAQTLKISHGAVGLERKLMNQESGEAPTAPNT